MGSYYNREGVPISMQEWSRLFSQVEYRQVALSQNMEFSISTIWLGLDHGWGNSSPMIFETLVEGPNNFEEMFRYSTLESALKNHKELANKYTPGNKVDFVPTSNNRFKEIE